MLHHNQTIIHKTLSDMVHFCFSSEEVPVFKQTRKTEFANITVILFTQSDTYPNVLLNCN